MNADTTQLDVRTKSPVSRGLRRVKEALAEGMPYAMAFVDVRMPPGWDGVETTQKILEIDPDIQIVICTAYADYSWGEMFEKIGNRDGLLILKKPFDAVEAFQLAHSLTEKWWLHQQSRRKMEELESRVAERTLELQRTNHVLQTEVTEHTRAATALRESEARTRLLVKSSGIGLWDWDLITNEVFFSVEWKSKLGYEDAELPNRFEEWESRLHPDDREPTLAAVKDYREGRRADYQVEFRLRHKDGSWRWILARANLDRHAASPPVRMRGCHINITERKRLEAQLFQSQKMETVGKLAGGVAHEFNSIMTAIIGQSELMLADLPAGNPLTKNATEIHRAADRAAALTRQLLAYGRKQILQPELLDLNRIIVSMEAMLHQVLGSDVDLRIIPAPGLQPVKVDAGQVEQVIMNLAVNARDAMPQGGKLTLETSNVTLEPESVSRSPDLKPGSYVMLAITDTGTGMTPEVKARLFEPFFSTKDVGQGTGLGLATCYGILKQSGGHINAYSEPGRGTTFKVYLPQVQAGAKTAHSAAPANLPRGTETILLVEDDPALREMASMLLGRLGYSVIEAPSGINALAIVEQQSRPSIDLLFTDVIMPELNGKQLSERILEFYPETRVLFTSAYTGNAIVHQGVLNEGVTLLQKPFTPSALANKVREVLDHPPLNSLITELAPLQGSNRVIVSGV